VSGGVNSKIYLDACVFCDSITTTFGNTPEFKRLLGDKITSRKIFETENFVVLPSVGQIVEGYLLIMPKPHFTSMANMDKALFPELEHVYSEVDRILKTNYTTPIFFEHGVCRSEYQYNGSCIDHAHIHAVPAPVDVSDELAKKYKFTKIKKVSELGEIAHDKNYLYVDNGSGNKFIFEANNIQSQLIRYLIDEKLNTPQKGDWFLYSGKEEMLATIKRLSQEKMKKFEGATLIVSNERKL